MAELRLVPPRMLTLSHIAPPRFTLSTNERPGIRLLSLTSPTCVCESMMRVEAGKPPVTSGMRSTLRLVPFGGNKINIEIYIFLEHKNTIHVFNKTQEFSQVNKIKYFQFSSSFFTHTENNNPLLVKNHSINTLK